MCRVGLTNSAHMKSLISSLSYNVIKTYMNQKTNSTTNQKASRRKRATSDLITCDDIDTAGSAASFFTASQLSTLSNSEFATCFSVLGSVTNWNTDQLQALANLAKIVIVTYYY